MTDALPTAPPEEIARRLAAFERTQDPLVLWPGLTESARVAAARELERVTRQILAEPRGIRVSLDPNAAHAAYALGVAGHTTGMGPVVGRWIEERRIVAAPGAAEMFTEHLAQARRRAQRMDREVLPALDALIESGVTPTVLKGFHTGRAYFEEPGARRMSDVDLLVAPGQIHDAEQALLTVGFRPGTKALKPYKRDWVGPSVDERLHSIEFTHEHSKWVLELHASLDRHYHPGAVAHLDPERSSVETLDVAGRQLLALRPALLVVFLACHCSQELDGIRLLRLFEIVHVVRAERAANRLDWDDVGALLTRTNTARFAYPALALVENLAPGTVDRRIIGVCEQASTWAARHTVARLVPAGGSLDDRGVMRQLMWTRGSVAIAQRLLRNVWPASFVRPGHVIPGWRVRLRRLRSGLLSLSAPDERR